MIFLDPYSPHIQNAKETHVATLMPIIQRRINKLADNDPLKAFLNKLRIKKIISDLPQNLLYHHIALLSDLPGVSVLGWKEYLRIKKIKSKYRNATEVSFYNGYKLLVDKLTTIFKYEGGFGVKKTKYSTYNLADALNVQTCVYCNRIYTKTVINPDKFTRPEFDHWYPQVAYPLFALSFYNLIPSCHICNSSVKGSTPMDITNYMHPYIPEDVDIKFSYWIKDLDTYTFKIKRPTSSKEDNTIKAFKLEEIYETHQDEIHDLVRLKKLYSVDYLLKLKGLLSNANQKVSMEELYRLAFGTHLEEKNFQKRPLSKMKRDILDELGII